MREVIGVFFNTFCYVLFLKIAHWREIDAVRKLHTGPVVKLYKFRVKISRYCN